MLKLENYWIDSGRPELESMTPALREQQSAFLPLKQLLKRDTLFPLPCVTNKNGQQYRTEEALYRAPAFQSTVPLI